MPSTDSSGETFRTHNPRHPSQLPRTSPTPATERAPSANAFGAGAYTRMGTTPTCHKAPRHGLHASASCNLHEGNRDRTLPTEANTCVRAPMFKSGRHGSGGGSMRRAVAYHMQSPPRASPCTDPAPAAPVRGLKDSPSLAVAVGTGAAAGHGVHTPRTCKHARTYIHTHTRARTQKKNNKTHESKSKPHDPANSPSLAQGTQQQAQTHDRQHLTTPHEAHITTPHLTCAMGARPNTRVAKTTQGVISTHEETVHDIAAVWLATGIRAEGQQGTRRPRERQCLTDGTMHTTKTTPQHVSPPRVDQCLGRLPTCVHHGKRLTTPRASGEKKNEKEKKRTPTTKTKLAKGRARRGVYVRAKKVKPATYHTR